MECLGFEPWARGSARDEGLKSQTNLLNHDSRPYLYLVIELLKMVLSRPLFLYFRLLSWQKTSLQFKLCQWLDLNRRPPVLEATALGTNWAKVNEWPLLNCCIWIWWLNAAFKIFLSKLLLFGLCIEIAETIFGQWWLVKLKI